MLANEKILTKKSSQRRQTQVKVKNVDCSAGIPPIKFSPSGFLSSDVIQLHAPSRNYPLTRREPISISKDKHLVSLVKPVFDLPKVTVGAVNLADLKRVSPSAQ